MAALVVVLVVGVAVGTAYASTSADLGGFSLDVKQITETYTSPPTGAQMYKAQCPSGYKPIGGGGLAYLSNSRTPLLASIPYDDGNLGWAVTYDVPASTWTVLVYATCMNIT